MPEWLLDNTSVIDVASTDSLNVIVTRLLASCLFGGAIAMVYRYAHGHQKGIQVWTMISTLVLLCVLIAMVAMVIGNSVARAFSLVGALSIVRFRTVVDDTRDTAFVIFAVIVGLAVGTGYFLIPMAGIPIASAVALGLDRFGIASSIKQTGRKETFELSVRVEQGLDPNKVVAPVFTDLLEAIRVISVETAKQGALLEIGFAIRMKPQVDPISLVVALNQCQGVIAVELKSMRVTVPMKLNSVADQYSSFNGPTNSI